MYVCMCVSLFIIIHLIGCYYSFFFPHYCRLLSSALWIIILLLSRILFLSRFLLLGTNGSSLRSEKTKNDSRQQNNDVAVYIYPLPNISYDRFNGLFDHILMVVCVNWNSPIDLLIMHDNLWKPVMKNIVYYGPFTKMLIEQMHVKGLQAVSRSDNDVKPEGTLAYRAVLDAIDRFPDFGGYLFKHDDVQINVTAMSTWNTSSIWSSDKFFLNQIPNFTHPHDGVGWWWRHPRAGLQAVMNSLQGSKEFAEKLVSCTGRNDTWPAVGT